MHYKDLIGQKVGSWTVLDVDTHGTKTHTSLLCKCDCGTVASVDAYSLRHNLTKSCGKCNRIISEETHMRCFMKNGMSFIFDTEDEPVVRKYIWSVTTGYARTQIDGKTVYLHKLLFGNPDNTEVDHINGNRLDNQRSNLRLANHAQNNQNKGLRRDSTTGYKGVCLIKSTGLYLAYINAYGKRYYLGNFQDKESAARAYDEAAKKLHGEYAQTNLSGTYSDTTLANHNLCETVG